MDKILFKNNGSFNMFHKDIFNIFLTRNRYGQPCYYYLQAEEIIEIEAYNLLVVIFLATLPIIIIMCYFILHFFLPFILHVKTIYFI